MTAIAQAGKSLYRYPPGSIERRLYQRILEIGFNPAYSRGFRTLAMEVQAGWMEIQPADLSTESIRAALLAAAKKERKEFRRRWQAGERNLAPFPEAWDAFIKTDKNGCRFSKWCGGDCDPSKVGDRQHWGITHFVHDPHFADAIGVQIFQNEMPDGSTDPAYLILSFYEGGVPCREAYDLRLSPVEARKFGEVLREASDPKGLRSRAPGVLVDLALVSGDRVVFERHRARTRKDGYDDREVFDVVLCPVDESVPLRMRSDWSNPSFLGKYLMSAADDAEGVIPPMFSNWEPPVEEAGRATSGCSEVTR